MILKPTYLLLSSGQIQNALGFAVLVWVVSGCAKNENPTLFQRLNADETGIDFRNEITEDEVHNILNFTNLYTGSGVGIGDVNRDGLPDIFFGGNQVSSRLYLNRGNLKFEDVTESAGLMTDRWVTGVAMVDVNIDGWPDIYLCVSGNASKEQRKNLLFINQQNGKFNEEAEAYGLADTTQSTHASFFDYDLDGDLDVYVAVNPTNYNLFSVNNIRKRKLNGEGKSTDRLYRNDDGKFVDVSTSSGILIEGYSLSLNTSDLTGDGWPDIYVTNDFLSNDIFYVNQKDGTFKNEAATRLKHTSFASMGVDVADINNDGHPEICALDMFPEDNFRQKTIMPGGNYDRFYYGLKMGYEPQYSRNVLQLNNGDGSFSEIGQLAGIHRTDWSWSALLADYDNDGLRDLFVTNGFRRDLGDLDYINYSNSNAFGSPESQKKEQLKRIVEQPGAKLVNYVFRNENGLQFSQKTVEWGLADSTYSHGAAFADLDLDGDLDLIVNNVGQPAYIYENRADEMFENHFLKIKLEGPIRNPKGFGAKVSIWCGEQIWYAEQNPYRGYLSTVDEVLHFGLGEVASIDSIRVVWSSGKVQVFENQLLDTELVVKWNDASDKENIFHAASNDKLVHETHVERGLQFLHQEDIQIDFKTQPLLPHQHSLAGPKVSKGDVNGDGLEDFFIVGTAGHPGQFFLQDENGAFFQKALEWDKEKEDVSSLLFDADEDGDLDLYVVGGGVLFSQNPTEYKDRFYENDGMGNFTPKENVLPEITSSGSCVKAADFDSDGDLDLFIGGRVVPGKYPSIPDSYLLENEGGFFKNITPEKLKNIGMVTDAEWTDYDSDEDLDLMVVGEFMPITFFENEKGHISHPPFPILHSPGWWNSIASGDFDGDGDPDYLLGNLGLNSDLKATPNEPVCIYANDFDKNGHLDPVLCHYVNGVEYPVHSRNELIGQIPPIKVRFTNYASYASASFPEVFKRPERKGMQVLRSENFTSSYLENLGDGEFELRPLPLEMQLAPIQDFHVTDVNEDGYLDALAVGNSYATEVVIGRYDAFIGAVLLGNGKGGFEINMGSKSGFKVDSDARSIEEINLASGQKMWVVGSNQDSLRCFEKRK